ncbi:MAG: tRNA (adenosine(37)-N6)-threonylcarbamoyltransferase complex dimerization subunit type 1 TsaB [Thermoanaerobaculia bacterium]
MTHAALDTGSPVTSVALARGEEILAARDEWGRLASERVLALLDDACREAGVTARDLEGLVALRGPGSFTGLRIGLATALGVFQAVGVPVTALSTLEVLAASVGPNEGPVLAVVDALRGEWSLQTFTCHAGLPEPVDEPRLVRPDDLPRSGRGVLVGFGVESLAEALAGSGIEVREAPPLAPVAARLAARLAPRWDPALLTRPLYARPPAVERPGSAP